MLRYQRLGILVGGNAEIADLLRQFPTPENREQLAKRVKDIDTRLAHIVSSCVYLIWYKHSQYEFPDEKIEACLSYALTAAEEYFHGDYRGHYQKYIHDPPYNRETSRVFLPWVDTFCMGLLCALLMNDREAVHKIATYADEDLFISKFNGRLDNDKCFYVLLGKYLCGEPLEKNNHILEILRGHRSRRPKLLLDILESIDFNSKEFGRNVIRYVKYFLKHELNKIYSLDEKEISLQRGASSIMASVLWETARFYGRELPELPEEIMDRIITRESLAIR